LRSSVPPSRIVDMLTFFRLFVVLVIIIIRVVRAVARSRADLILENLVLRQQVTALKQQRPRPSLNDEDRGFWVALKNSWPGWIERLMIVKPKTIIRWHRQRFRWYWTRISRKNRSAGRPRIEPEIRKLIRSMAIENAWGAPRIHGELMKLWIHGC
jgi:putative transposase